MKKIIILDAIIVMVSLTVLVLSVGYASPLVISPISAYETSENQVIFSFEKANLILLDDNLQFTSPEEIYVRDQIAITLEPGIYYWKIKGALSSETRKLTIHSRVELILQEQEGGYNLVNAGNVDLDVKVYDGEELISEMTVVKNQVSKANGTKFIGSPK